ncbi:30S ribosomal protein S1 [Clostridium sp. cel8]|uniref:30S ribosomal protein S1 n=1 Tax=unclassified Clostridium TaxID=2614128 RepID=UPI0015F4D73A|nr:30S ribosomal protein S1 [Clostridium sp. cel8]MBA5850417.1 30S ribosomal protein S1 [Clostridium sp. cel8]
MEDNNIISMNEIINEIDSSIKNIKVGEVVTGKIIAVTSEELIVNIGYVTDGIVKRQEINIDSNLNLEDCFKVGEEINVYIEKIEDEDGNVALSKVKADEILAWNKLNSALKNDDTVKVVVDKVVKGGLICNIGGIQAFMPASQVSVKYVDDLSGFVGKVLNTKIIELDKRRNRVVISRREVEQIEIENKKNDILNSIEPGQKVKGKVDRITKFGAFVDLGGIDGLIHISELSWERVKDPHDVVSVGDELEVYVLNVDREKSKISLSLKDVDDDPWNKVEEKYKIGDNIRGKIVKFINIGAFVEIEAGIEGFVHISEMSYEHIAKPEDIVNLGDFVDVKILNIDMESKRISLSMKDASEGRKNNYEEYLDNSEGFSLGEILKDKFKNLN